MGMGKGTETTTHEEIKTDEEIQKKTKTQRQNLLKTPFLKDGKTAMPQAPYLLDFLA